MLAYYTREQYEALEFHVEELGPDERVETLLGCATNALAAIAMFDEYAESRPLRHLRLRHRARVLREQKPGKGAQPAAI
nr:hypothetical protein [Brucella anthropi]DAM62847.1 MAG TPA: hypothetical protein [Caudoviricetes sp.]